MSRPPAAVARAFARRALPAAVLCLAGCVNDPEVVFETAEKIQPSVERGRDVTMVYSEDGEVQLQLRAPRVVRRQGEEPVTEFPEGLKVTFFDAALRPSSTLEADYGIRDENAQEVTVRDHVVVVNDVGERLDTEELVWNARDRKIRSDAFVKITTAEEVLYGTGFEADETFSRYRILEPEGSFRVEEQP